MLIPLLDFLINSIDERFDQDTISIITVACKILELKLNNNDIKLL